MTTLDDFFKAWTEAEAAEDQAAARQTLAAVDAARQAKDWETLKQLGFAQQADGPREGTIRWEFDDVRYDDLRRELALTPAQLASRRNAAMDW